MTDDFGMTDTFLVFEPRCYEDLFDCPRAQTLSNIANLGISYLIFRVTKAHTYLSFGYLEKGFKNKCFCPTFRILSTELSSLTE
jgi:hypothetical protein